MGSLASTTLKVGDPACDFALLDLEGRPFELVDVLQGGTVLLLFSPGAWSKNARRQILDLEALVPRLDALGVIPLLLITQDRQEAQKTLQAFLSGPDRSLSRPSLSFPVLVDEDRHVAQDYGVFRAISLNGFRVCRPAVFLIDPSGDVSFIYVGDGDADVPDMQSLVHLIGALAGPRLIPIAPRFGRGQRLVQGWNRAALPRLSAADVPALNPAPQEIPPAEPEIMGAIELPAPEHQTAALQLTGRSGGDPVGTLVETPDEPRTIEGNGKP